MLEAYLISIVAWVAATTRKEENKPEEKSVTQKRNGKKRWHTCQRSRQKQRWVNKIKKGDFANSLLREVGHRFGRRMGRIIPTWVRNKWDVLTQILFRENKDVYFILWHNVFNVGVDRRMYQERNEANQHRAYEDDPDRGRTYAEHLPKKYGGEGFANKHFIGKCTECPGGLPAWRRCIICINQFLLFDGDDILNICLDCKEEEHQQALIEDELCYFCGGPPPLQVLDRKKHMNCRPPPCKKRKL